MSTGLGLLPITFDWSQIAYNGSPLVVPFWAQANVFAGWAFFFALVTPILYYTNTWSVYSAQSDGLVITIFRYTSYLPLSGSNSYDNTASVYNVSKIVNSQGNFEPAAYEAYSTIFMPATFALSYGISFAVMSCLPVHVYLYHWADIKHAFMGTSKKDIHARLIMRYKDVPWWCYPTMTVSSSKMSYINSRLTQYRLWSLLWQ